MSKDSSDKQTYTVDEMMDRLRDGDREKRSEGELVTRADGTQVVRVKKRRRRSKQKKAEEAKKRRRMSLVRTIFAVTTPLVLGLAALLLLARYHSSTFQEGVVGDIWNKTGGKAQLSRMSPLGTKVKAQRLNLNWPTGNRLDSLRAERIAGDLDLIPFVKGKLRGNELRAEDGYLITSMREERKIRQPKGEPLAMPGFDRYAADQFNFYFGKKKSAFRLEKTNVRFIPRLNSRQLLLEGGSLIAGSWGEMAFERGTLEFSGNSMKVVSLRFEEENRNIVLEGNLDFRDSLHSLSVEVVAGDVAGVAGFGLEKLFSANLVGTTGTLVFRPWDVASHELTLSSSPDYLSLQNFAFLGQLEELYGDARFQNFEFEVEQGFELARASQGAEFRILELREEGIFALKGLVGVAEGRLTGEIEVGLPSHRQFAIARYTRDLLFRGREPKDGFFWFKVDLSGTPESPADNFRQYLIGPKAVADPEDIFNELTR